MCLYSFYGALAPYDNECKDLPGESSRIFSALVGLLSWSQATFSHPLVEKEFSP